MWDDDDDEGKREVENPVPASSLLLPISTKGPPGESLSTVQIQAFYLQSGG